MDSKFSDEELMIELQNGSKTVFEELFNRHEC